MILLRILDRLEELLITVLIAAANIARRQLTLALGSLGIAVPERM